MKASRQKRKGIRMQQKKENVKVKSVRRESKFLCGEIEGRKWDTQIFWFDESFLTNFPDFKFISAGDWVQITYKKENVKKSFTDEKEERKKILSIEKWRVNDMRNRIIKILKDAMELSDKTKTEYGAICNKYSLTSEGKTEQRQKAMNKIAGEMARKTEEGLKLFDKRIEDINQEEQKELERKNASLEYQQMITEKATVLEMISDTEEVPHEYLKQYLQEFENDPVAILVMQSCVKGANLEILAAIPQNNLGMRQEALRQLKDEFKESMILLGQIDDVNDISKNTVIENYISYLEKQNDDFSIPAEEIWEAINQDGHINFNFKFSSKEEIHDRMVTMGAMK